MNRFSHVDLAAPPPHAGGERGGKGGAPRAPAMTGINAPPFPPPAGGAQRGVALRGVVGHEGQGGSAAPEPVEATKARSSSLTSLG